MQTPVKIGDANSGLRSLQAATLNTGARNEGIVLDVIHRLGHTPIDQAGAEAGAEQHADPGEGRKIRFLIVLAKPDIAKAAHQHPKDKEQGKIDDGNIEPVQRADDEVLGFGEGGLGIFDISNGEDRQS